MLDWLRFLQARGCLNGHGLAEALPGMDPYTRNLIWRTLWDHPLEEVLFWTDEDWLSARNVGPARLALVRAHWPSPAAARASSLGGWIDHADMVAGVDACRS